MDALVECADFVVHASQLGALLGCFGARKQMGALCSVWHRSSLRASCKPHWDRTEASCAELGVQTDFEALLRERDACVTREQLQVLETRCFTTLFRNVVVTGHVEQLAPPWRAVLESVLTDTSAQRLGALLSCFTPEEEPSDEEPPVEKDFPFFPPFPSSLPAAPAPAQCPTSVSSLAPPAYTETSSTKRCKLEAPEATSATPERNARTFLAWLQPCWALYNRFKRDAACAYGTKGERLLRLQYNQLHVHAIEPCDRQLHKRLPSELLGPQDERTWMLDGRVDGLRRGEIVEIKHRKTQLHDELRLYEKMQLHAYMCLLDQPRAHLVQCVSTQSGLFCKETTVHFEPDFWQWVLTRVAKCVRLIVQLHSNPLARDCFFALGDKGLATLFHEHCA